MRASRCVFGVFGVVMAMGVGVSARAEVIYSQPNDQPSRPSLFSDGVAGQFFSQRMADNFTASASATMTGLRWWGGSQNFQFRDLTNMTAFVVRIYEDGGGVPDAEIFNQTFAKSDTGPAATGFLLSGQGIQYAHTVELSSPVMLTGGMSYWVSVGAILDQPSGDAWVWCHSSVGDGVNASDFFTGGQYVTFTSGDMAFEVLGAVPGPGSAGGLAAGMMVAARRRR